MTTDKIRAGRKPSKKAWDVKFAHTFRTDYATDSDLHVLLFMAGDHASQLIQAALRAFAKSNGIPVDDPDFQESVCLQAGTVIAKTKRSPCATEVMQSLGQSTIVKNLIRSIESGGQSVSNVARQPEPKAQAPALPKPKSTPAIAPSPVVAIGHQPVPTVATPIDVAPPKPITVDAPRPKKAPVNIDMGPEIEIDMGGSEPVTNGATALKNRWLSAHDY